MVRIALSWHGDQPEYEAYERALRQRAEALGIPIALDWLAGTGRPTRTHIVKQFDGICFTGGEDVEPARYGRADAAAVCRTNPNRDATEWGILEALDGHPLPLLGICRGAQLLNVFHGGTLIPDLAALNAAHRAPPEKEHEVCIVARTKLAELGGAGSAVVNSSHHQAVEQLAPHFRICATAHDGTIEAFEGADAAAAFMLAVQWHPELMALDLPLSGRVLDGFLLAATEVPRGTM